MYIFGSKTAMQLFYQPALAEGFCQLTEEESRHAVKVLRMAAGDELQLTDGQGSFYQARITEAHQKHCRFEVTGQEKVPPYPVYRHLAIAPTKNIDRLEWCVEKAVELGVDRITPILCHHSERRVVKTERLERKAVSAMKQSLKAWMPQIDELMPLEALIKSNPAAHRYIAYVDQQNPDLLKDLVRDKGHHLVLIGPEGDFSEAEVSLALEQGFQKVGLGPSRLRTETAGIAAVHLLNL